MRIGVDLVDVERFQRYTANASFVTRSFTQAELGQADGLSGSRRQQWLAGRFAAKEAAAKALGTGFAEGVSPLSIEVLSSASGAPLMTLTGHSETVAHSMGCTEWNVSISHDGNLAMAFVILT